MSGEIKDARSKGLPPSQPCFEDDAEPNQIYDAHHMQPLYLNGKDQEFNLCALETDRHHRGHRSLDDQSNMVESHPVWLACDVTEGHLSKHPKGQMYEIEGTK